ncbi:hypothetical protein Nepgr_016493 [Nepenthes gracilis]|uniref:Uncharacterized protein n=1 Tax=Nepenthes gracilis TaxID=150966 RepID=A0AAD3XRD3_NEPGR|nr:hypothetical protein Nepgr_016493 [Nepenthes gracilis]
MDKQIGMQQTGPGFAPDLGQLGAAMRYEVSDDLVPSLDQPELGLGPMMAPCPISSDRVEKSSVLSTNLQLVDRPPADAESSGFLDTVSSPSPLVAPTDHHGKALRVLSRGLGAGVEGISVAGDFELGVESAVAASHSPQDGQFIHHDSAPDLEVDLDLTPNSISHLSSKYSLDSSCIVALYVSVQVELVSVSLGDSLDGGREGWAQDVPREVQIQPASGDHLSLASSSMVLSSTNVEVVVAEPICQEPMLHAL